jgi:hypothetical protein
MRSLAIDDMIGNIFCVTSDTGRQPEGYSNYTAFAALDYD